MKATASCAESARPRSRCRPRCCRRGPRSRASVGKPIAVGIRPEALDEPGRRDGGDGGRLRGRVQAVEALGPEQLVHVEVDAKPVLAEDVLEGLVDEEAGRGPRGDQDRHRRHARARPSSPGSMRRRASGPTSRSSLRSTSATSTSSISAAARRSVPEPATADPTACGSRFSTGRPSSSATSAATSTACPQRPASSPRIRAFCRARC